MISAVIFDFDGVIVDSERLHWAAFNAVMEPRGKTIEWPEYLETYIGFDDRDAFRCAFPNLGKDELPQLIQAKAAAFQELLNDGGAAALPGSVELIQHLSGTIPIAICSGALKEDIFPIIGKLGVADAFDQIVTADDTHISKPDPAPYLLAKERLRVASGIAIEDTPAGIASAKGAGLKVLAVTNSYPKELLKDADVIVDTLDGLTGERLTELFA
ncbi:HAD family hydrolase [Tichowtungia aerotolerans]|uniref:HAD-IA family hydrolase n=1 Tax=Tichowtungia aerotolerans TaxID=2697043 RepID=A0A6P1MDY6_9BACT|nr:HAD family phosphatase [Tichowtungia aerotolerans]QHI69305.1 HAD-IA family hydrolase [Tichowtungia aerotolerans]